MSELLVIENELSVLCESLSEHKQLQDVNKDAIRANNINNYLLDMVSNLLMCFYRVYNLYNTIYCKVLLSRKAAPFVIIAKIC